MNHLWKVPCWAKPLKIWLSRATQRLFLSEFQTWLWTTEKGWDTLKRFQSPGWKEQVGRVHWGCLRKSLCDGTCSAGSLTQEGALLSAQIYSGYTIILLPWSGVKGLTGEAINSTELRFGYWLLELWAAQEQEEVGFPVSPASKQWCDGMEDFG